MEIGRKKVKTGKVKLAKNTPQQAENKLIYDHLSKNQKKKKKVSKR